MRFRLALLQVFRLLVVSTQLIQHHLPTVAILLQLLHFPLLLVRQQCHLSLFLFRLLLLRPQCLPGALGLIAGLLLTQFAQAIHLLTIADDALVKLSQITAERSKPLNARLVVAARLAAARQQFLQSTANLPGDLITITAGHFPETGTQHRLEVIAGMGDRLAKLLTHTLLDP